MLLRCVNVMLCWGSSEGTHTEVIKGVSINKKGEV